MPNILFQIQSWLDTPEYHRWWNNIYKAVRNGDIQDFKDHFDQMASRPEEYIKNTVSQAFPKMFKEATCQGHLEIFDYLWKHPACEDHDASHYLLSAVNYKQTDIFFYILKNAKPGSLKRHQTLENVLIFVLQAGDIAMARELIPHVRVKNGHSMFLRQAARNQQWGLFDLLLPHSNFEAALSYTKSSGGVSPEEKAIFKKIDDARTTKKLLKKELKNAAPLSAPPKKKM